MSTKNNDNNDKKNDVPFRYNVCSDYTRNIPMDNNNTTSCSDYDIPMDTTTSSTTSSSSVLDKGVVESRGILDANNNEKKKTRDQVTDEIQSFFDSPWEFRREVRSLLSVLMFVTRLPVPRGIDIHPGYLMKGMTYFPVVGCLIGIIVAAVFDVLHVTLPLPPLIAACGSTAVGWWLTGCFHEDGLADSADGT